MRSAARLIIPVLTPRALLLWMAVRLTFAMLPLAANQPFGSPEPSPFGVVLLAGVLGLLDVRRRGERILWANLGITQPALFASYAVTAVPAELILQLLRG